MWIKDKTYSLGGRFAVVAGWKGSSCIGVHGSVEKMDTEPVK